MTGKEFFLGKVANQAVLRVLCLFHMDHSHMDSLTMIHSGVSDNVL